MDGPAPAAPVEDAEVPSVAVGPAGVDGAVVVRREGVSPVPGRLPWPVPRGAPPADGPGAGAPPPGAAVPGGSGATGGCGGGLGAGLVVGFGAGRGGAGAAGGAIAGWPPAPNAQPSTVPGAGSYPPAPSVLYRHDPPREACQYDQYAVVGAPLQGFGLASIWQTSPGCRGTNV